MNVLVITPTYNEAKKYRKVYREHTETQLRSFDH